MVIDKTEEKIIIPMTPMSSVNYKPDFHAITSKVISKINRERERERESEPISDAIIRQM